MSKTNPFTVLFFWIPLAALISMTVLFGAAILVGLLIDWVRGRL